jgi:uncharacterized protein YjbI with pentapeptide repeats
LRGPTLEKANLVEANLLEVNLREANLESANLEWANLKGADLEGTRNLSFDQLSRVKTLYDTKLDKELLISLKEKYPALFAVP